MQESILYIVIFIVAVIIGVLIGMYIANLKNKASLSGLEERDIQLQSSISSLQEHIEKTEKEREEIRREKEKELSKELATEEVDDSDEE